MKQIDTFLASITKPLDNVRGIAGFGDWKFYLAFLFYATSFLVLIRDPFFFLRGEVVFQQGMITLLMAVVLLNTVYWDLQLFGKPVGANLLLQVLSYLPGSMLIARLFGKATAPESVTLGGELWDLTKSVANKIVDFPAIPPWISDMVCNWKISIVFVLLLVILSVNLRKQFKVAALFLFLLVPFLTEIAAGNEIVYLCGGTILFLAGLSLQFCRYDKVIYFEQIDASLHQSPELDTLLLRSIMRIMTRLYQEEAISEQNVRAIVAEEYNAARGAGDGYNDMEINQIALGVTKKMIHSFSLVHIKQSGDGAKMYPNRKLFVCDSMLRGLAIWPRALAVFAFALLWSISPIDLIPDALPLVGTLDDVIVGIATTLMIGSTIVQEKNE